MTSNLNNVGICTTCDFASGCQHYLLSKDPIWYCENFIVGENRNATITLNDTYEFFTKTEDYSDIHKGLCMNCENQENCRHQKNESGVWHCEDYR